MGKSNKANKYLADLMSKIPSIIFLLILTLISCEKKGDCTIKIIEGGDTLTQRSNDLSEEECVDLGGKWSSY